MYNIKHLKTIYTKNDTSLTLLSVVAMFILPVSVFSFCYFTQNDASLYAVKSIDVLENDLKVLSVASSATCSPRCKANLDCNTKILMMQYK